MPVFPEGSAAHLAVSTDWDGTQGDIATATWTPVDGISEAVRANQANTTDHNMFMRASAVTTTGQPSRTITLNGFYSPDDAGQMVLRAHAPGGASSGTAIGYRFRPTGTAGGANGAYAVLVKVGGGEERANAAGGLQPTSFTLAPQADAVSEA